MHRQPGASFPVSLRIGGIPVVLLVPVLVSAVLVAFMFYWNGRQARLLTDWWRERTARSALDALPRLAGCSPRELIDHPERISVVLPQSGIEAFGLANAQGWVAVPFGAERERLQQVGPFPPAGVTVLSGDSFLVARLPLRGGPGRGMGHGPGMKHGQGRRIDADEARGGSPLPGGGPFEAVFLLSENGVPPVGPLILQRWLWPLAWLAGSVMWIGLFRHRERLSELERDRQREAHLTAVGQATARLAHEIKNPLGAIRGAAQHVLGKPLSGTQQEMMRLIEQETGRLEDLARGILDFARPLAIRPADCDPGAMLRDIRSMQLLRSPHPEIILEGLEEPLSLRCDPAAMTQILQNLLENARAASGAGSTVEPLVVRVDRTDGFFRIRVLDRGEGLSDEARAHLFEPFFSTKIQGYGLGLVVSRRLAEAHGGTLRLEPREGGGCCAELRIPER